jgi:hypothetical protein
MADSLPAAPLPWKVHTLNPLKEGDGVWIRKNSAESLAVSLYWKLLDGSCQQTSRTETNFVIAHAGESSPFLNAIGEQNEQGGAKNQ